MNLSVGLWPALWLAVGANWFLVMTPLVVLGVAAIAAGAKRDVIMIAIDDMRPELGCYGCDYMKVVQLVEFWCALRCMVQVLASDGPTGIPVSSW